MKAVKHNFQERCDEINLYFTFLEKVKDKATEISYPDGTSEKLDPILRKTLKANSFLLLYNLTEYSIKKAVEAIVEEIIRDGLKYEEAIAPLKTELIRFIKNKVGTDDFVTQVSNISDDIFAYCLNLKEKTTDTQPQYVKDLFSGNIHAKTISNLAEKYGFSHKTNPRLTDNGKALQVVKDKRNDLAHGVFSFQEVGKDFTEQDLLKIKKQVIAYLKQILNNIEKYISNKGFRI